PVEIILLQKRQQMGGPAPAGPQPLSVERGRLRDKPRREALVGAVVVVHRQADLLEVIGAFQPSRRLADLLDVGKETADEDGDDGYHTQQLDQREALASGVSHRRSSLVAMEYDTVFLLL